MSTLTPNLGLKVPEATDPLETVRSDYAYNLNQLDENGGGGGGSGHTIVNENGTDMPAEGKLQFTGNVSVTDDNTNGKTIVDVEGGASVVELTQAEYEALPDSKLTDGILYGLKDVKSFLDADILYLGTCYSTSERMVGCWVDGKPLYTRTFALPSPINVSPSSWDSMGVTVADGENVIFCWGIATDGTGSPLMGYFSSNVLMCQTPRNNNPSYSIQYLIVQYTKTTDIAGSGTWTPSGVNAVHYDTNEQIIGTYLGKTLYQKTYSGLSISCTSQGTWYSTGQNYGDIEKIISCEIIDQYGQNIGGSAGYMGMTPKPIAINCPIDNRVITELTVRYTKTTD